MRRREFLKAIGLGTTGLSLLGGDAWTWAHREAQGRELAADVVITGGGVGGCAAALAALRNGLEVIMTEETDWIGGQLTQQAVPADEHPWIEQFGATRSYRKLRESIRTYYRRWYPLTSAASDHSQFNPGNCGVSRLCHEPRVALAVLENMFAQYVSSGQLTLLLEHRAESADTTGDFVDAVVVRDLQTGENRHLTAPYFLDATELGDLLPLTGTEYVTGAESRRQTGEPHAPLEAQPDNMQAATWCFSLDYREGENHRIERPDEYEFWRDYVPDLDPPWPGKLFSFTYSNPRTLEPRELVFDPRPNATTEGYNLWVYRRLTDPDNFRAGAYKGGTTLVNWPQNDFLLGNFMEVSDEEAARNMNRAQQLSRSLVYWLQTDAPRPDGGTGWPGLRLRGDLTGTDHGLAKYPYIRESRRIKAETTVVEQHVGLEARMQETGLSQEEVHAKLFDDSVGVGSYRIDLHPSTGGDNYIDISSLPFQIPLGSLIPQRVENLLPAGKNLGVTHITNGCYRLHPVEWNIGESAGMLAAYCVENGYRPREVRHVPKNLDEFQRLLSQQGIELEWPTPLRSAR